MDTESTIRAAARLARSLRGSFPHGRLRVTPAVHQELAEGLCVGTPLDPLSVILTDFAGLRVVIDADAPDPGWIIDTWRHDADRHVSWQPPAGDV